MATYNLKANHVDKQADILANMSKADFDALAKTHLNLDEMIMIVVGDKAAVYDDVAALGYNMVESRLCGHR